MRFDDGQELPVLCKEDTMHVKFNSRKARAFAKVHKAVWAWRRAQAVAAWDGSDFEWVSSHVEAVFAARRAAKAVR